MSTAVAPRMKARFNDDVKPKVKETFGVTNPMAMPRFEKIIINVGMGRELEGTKLRPAVREQVLSTLTQISGQKPIIVRAKKAVSNFKVREGYEIGAMVTLRGERMWEFFDRLVNLTIPRIKDFRGLPDNSFDKQGNYSFGVNEQGIFPEIDMSEATYTHGMHLTIVIRNSDKDKSTMLLREMGFPFVKREEA